jgi:hypothetical protein
MPAGVAFGVTVVGSAQVEACHHEQVRRVQTERAGELAQHWLAGRCPLE